MGAERRAEIQWLRAIAATEVAICHSDLVTKHFSSYHLAESWWHRGVGGIGVEIFFMVSGYVICMTAGSHKTGGAFLLSRIRRIYPMYWIFTSLVVLAYLVNSDWHLANFDPGPLSLIRSYLILPQPGFPILGVGWTLEHEMLFYALIAVVMLFWSMRGAAKGAVIWLLAALGFLGCLHGTQAETSVLTFHVFSPYFLAFGFGWLLRYIEGMPLMGQAQRVALFLIVGAAGYVFGSEYGAHLMVRIATAGAVFALFLAARPLFAADNAVEPVRLEVRRCLLQHLSGALVRAVRDGQGDKRPAARRGAGRADTAARRCRRHRGRLCRLGLPGEADRPLAARRRGPSAARAAAGAAVIEPATAVH